MRLKQHLWKGLASLPLMVFAMQWPLTVTKLHTLGCGLVTPSAISVEEVGAHIKRVYEIELDKPYLVLGHVIENHRVLRASDQTELLPVTHLNTIKDATWPEVFVYQPGARERLIIENTYPRTARLNGFSGLRPRQCESADVLSVPSISRTLDIISHFLLTVFLLVVCFASVFASRSTNRLIREDRSFLISAATIYTVALLMGTHLFDSFRINRAVVYDGLRFLATVAPFVPILGSLSLTRRLVTPFLGIVLATAVFALAYPKDYLLINASLHIVAAVALTGSRDYVLATIYLATGAEIIGRITGFRPHDFPPTNFYLMALGTYVLFTGWRAGASQVLPQVKRAYETILRDVHLSNVCAILDPRNDSGGNDDLSKRLETAMREVPLAVGCGRAALLLLEPNKPAITMTYDHRTQHLQRFDDGKVEGAIFTRVLLYLESLWFASITELRKQGYTRLQKNTKLVDAEYFCAIPLLHGTRAIGVLALTRFDDRTLNGNDGAVVQNELKTKITVLAKQIEASLQSNILNTIEETKARVNKLTADIEVLALSAEDGSSFLTLACKKLRSETSSRVLLFKRMEGDTAICVNWAGLSVEELAAWQQQSLNLNPKAGNKIGQVVVAFNEGRSSYIRRASEIFPQLHPKTVEILKLCRAETIISVPFGSEDQKYVLLLMSEVNGAPLQPYWGSILEELSYTLAAYLRACEQQSSLTAFGRIMVRFIGDDGLRRMILDHAGKPDLPPTIGVSKTSLLLLPDIIGSSRLSGMSSNEKALQMGLFYNDTQRAAAELLHAVPRKATGDGMILAAEVKVSDSKVLERIMAFAEACESSAQRIGCDGVRLCIHYGEYFCGMVGTHSFAQIDVMGTEIDRVCKLEAETKVWKEKGVFARLALSEAAFVFLSQTFKVEPLICDPTGVDEFVGKYFLFDQIRDLIQWTHGVVPGTFADEPRRSRRSRAG